MARGPLPDPKAVRRNKPTIPTLDLPASGRQGPAPEPPAWSGVVGGTLAREWWDWAWSLPEAVMWSEGDMQPLVRLATITTTPWADIDTKIMATMAALEDRLGLSVKAKAALRAKIVPDADAVSDAGVKKSDEVATRRQRRKERITGAAASAGTA